MAYVVLARKWRPGQFSDIVGQGHIVRTLMNAIRGERIHQAYLFTGSRGIGKTSIARIFAKAIRCESARITPDTIQSCDQCSSCKEITSGNSVDVIEIDGASNNGVEAVREIRENAKYMPATGSRKIYIIDEVHMLTTAAFNALLKTLEEPPAHVIFIFATTEPHKIPATILSRCQRFDFRRVTMAQIQTRLTEIMKAEGIQAEPAALSLIARAAEGGMRDALSLLDQVIAFSGSQISAQSVRESIGLIEGQTLLGIVSAIFARKPLDALALVEQAYQRGHDLRVLTRSLIEFLHSAILAKVGSQHSATLELSDDEWKELAEISKLRSLEEIELIFQVLHHGVDWIARSPQPKIVLDVLLVKCATAEALVHLESGTAGPSTGTSHPTTTARPTAAAAPAKSATPAPVKMATPAASPAISQVTVNEKADAETVNGAQTATAPAATTETVTVTASATAGARSWEGFIDAVRKTRPLVASILEHGNCLELPQAESIQLSICFQPDQAYYKEQLQTRMYHEQLVMIAKEYFGKPGIKLQIELREGGESLAARKEREIKEREKAAKEAAQNHPIIMEAKAVFGGELGPIQLVEQRSGEMSTHA